MTCRLSDKFPLEESLALISRQGYQRLLVDGASCCRSKRPRRGSSPRPRPFVTVIQDRVKLADAQSRPVCRGVRAGLSFRQRETWPFASVAVGTADAARPASPTGCIAPDAILNIANRRPALFSFNHPIGACPACRGFGRIIAIDYNAAMPDRSKTLAGGAVKPWQTPSNAECQEDLMKFARLRKVPVDVPFRRACRKKWQDWVIEGDPDYGKDKAHAMAAAPGMASKAISAGWNRSAYKMHVRVLLSRYRIYETCPDCHGARFRPETLLYRIDGLTLADFYQLPVRQALAFIDTLAAPDLPKPKTSDPMAWRLGEVRSRLAYSGRSRAGLSDARPPDPFAFRRRNRTGQPHRLPRLAACQYFVCAR